MSWIFIALTIFYAAHRHYEILSKSLVPSVQFKKGNLILVKRAPKEHGGNIFWVHFLHRSNVHFLTNIKRRIF